LGGTFAERTPDIYKIELVRPQNQQAFSVAHGGNQSGNENYSTRSTIETRHVRPLRVLRRAVRRYSTVELSRYTGIGLLRINVAPGSSHSTIPMRETFPDSF
jgi:hypothetical protein